MRAPWRVFFTCWITYTVFWTPYIVREHPNSSAFVLRVYWAPALAGPGAWRSSSLLLHQPDEDILQARLPTSPDP